MSSVSTGNTSSSVPASTVLAPVRDLAYLSSWLKETRDERNQVESEKLHLEARIHALMNALPAAVIVLDGEGRVREANSAAEVLLQTRLNGRLWRELINEVFQAQNTITDALQLRNGRQVTFSTQPLGIEPGQVVMLQDVTDNQQLRSRLEQSRRLIDMGRMAASLAHQIRTPLSSAMLYVSHLHSNRLDTEKRSRFITKALNSLKGLEQLVNDMLLFTRDGKGERELLDPAELFSSLCEDVNNDSKVMLDCKSSSNAEKTLILVNRVLLKSAIQNLLNNAAEAGAKSIVLQQRNAGTWTELLVRDDGCGIEVHRQQHVFEPFVSGRSNGNGLGLAVVRAVVQSMDGEVTLQSQPGKGTEFVLRFPTVSEFSSDKNDGTAVSGSKRG